MREVDSRDGDRRSQGTDPRDGDSIAPGTVLADRFRVGRALGEGGHGSVYLAEHVTLGYPVAVKVLRSGLGLDSRRRARFRREALLGAQLRHRNVVSILDAGELDDGAPFLVMEHVDGVDLESLVERVRLDAAASVEIGVQLLAALVALVERGVIHRDIKPGNVMLHRCVDGFVEVKLLDFGISKALRGEVALETLTADDCVLGTPQYMPPEQVRGEVLDVRADLYSVGGVLFECLTGEPPFDADTAGSVLARILVERARPVRSLRPDVPEEIASIVDRALQHDPADRWARPEEMSEALRAAARRLGLPRGADAWGVLDRDGAPSSAPVAIGQASCSTLSAPESAGGALAGTPHESVGAAQSSEGEVGVSALRGPGARRARRALVVALAALVALAMAAATASGDGGNSAPARAVELPAEVPAPGAQAAPFVAARLPRPERARPVNAPRPSVPPPRHGAERLDLDPADLEARALDAFLVGRERESIALYRRVTELAPERSSAWRGLGLAAASAGDRRPALRALRRYLELAPDAPDRAGIERQIQALAR